MQRKIVLSVFAFELLIVASYISIARASQNRRPVSAPTSYTQGALQVIDSERGVVALCPLKHTDVKAEISGFIARVIVTQEFENPFKEKIEAVYTFPLPQNSAVDDMTMRVGDRTVHGRIKRREEARAVYDAARSAGQVASLLDQERPNIFTQSVANIMPGEKVTVTISYVETLKYEDGSYEFVFPMVVGPRYIPGAPVDKQSDGRAPRTDRVPDAPRITPPVSQPGTRAGHDISLEVALDAGVPIDGLKSTQHDIEVERPSLHSAVVGLKDKAVIPNKDFVLRYDVSGRRIEDAVLTHRSGGADPGDGFFTMILQPPERVTAQDVMPKELVFVLDTSGSMMGFPIEKAKETMKLALDALYPQDTFNLITFAGDTSILFPEPVPATRENLAKAQSFLDSRTGSGGTEMMKAIRAALDPSDAQDHIRIVCFMTDGYVGNDMEIISEVQKHPNARVFAFGIGGSVNRFLLDKMAEQGRGEVEYVALNDDGSAAAKRFHERVRNPLLTDISIDWSGLPVTDVYPQRIPDLFSAKPVIVSGRFTGARRGTIKLNGRISGRDFAREIPIDLPEIEARHSVLATLWARMRIDDLMSQDYSGIQNGNPRDEIREAITQLGLNFRLMTQFTSFVAVEEMTVTDGDEPRRIEVPVEIPEGVSHTGVFGEADKPFERLQLMASLQRAPLAARKAPAGGGGGGGGGRSTGVAASKGALPKMSVKPMPPPPPPPPAATARRDGRAGRAGSGSGSGGGMGSGAGKGVGPGTGFSMGGGTARLGGGSSSPPVSPPSPEELKRRELLSKMNPSIAAVIERLKNKGQPTPDEAKFVRNGKAEIQVWLSDKSPKTVTQLKELGFEVVLDPKSSKIIIGRVPIEKLAALAELKTVRYVAPITSN
ncbi:MAG TPA: VIT and VWA domain-containing protein [Blastocatellia bacterium]|nr:VIT and VWA domain-containing protein [Blastocatellia bacterium]